MFWVHSGCSLRQFHKYFSNNLFSVSRILQSLPKNIGIPILASNSDLNITQNEVLLIPRSTPHAGLYHHRACTEQVFQSSSLAELRVKIKTLLSLKKLLKAELSLF
jgi:hypothetical protein